MYGDPAFLNSTKLFEEAFSSREPREHLMKLLAKHPTWNSVRELVIAYICEVGKNPSRGTHLASILSELELGDAQQIDPGNPEAVSTAINRELADSHFKSDGGSHTWGPENRYLLDSYLSGLSLRHDLTMTSDMLAAVHDGLNVQSSCQNAQEMVVGACIQLLLAGTTFIFNAGTYQRTAEEIAAKLKKQRNSGIVQEPTGMRLLEVSSRFNSCSRSVLIFSDTARYMAC